MDHSSCSDVWYLRAATESDMLVRLSRQDLPFAPRFADSGGFLCVTKLCLDDFPELACFDVCVYRQRLLGF